jgi:hypothetical protein
VVLAIKAAKTLLPLGEWSYGLRLDFHGFSSNFQWRHYKKTCLYWQPKAF